MISETYIDRQTILCYSVLCLPIAIPDHLPPSHFHFCLLHIQVFSFQGIAHSFPERPSHNPLPINYFRTLFIATGGVPPSLCIPESRHSSFATCYRIQTLSFHILAHSFVGFCTRQELNSFIFNQFPLFVKKARRGRGTHAFKRHPRVTTSLRPCYALAFQFASGVNLCAAFCP